jgi:hypothetical protein
MAIPLWSVPCWSGACDQLLVRWDGCFIRDVHSHGVFFREYTTPSSLLIVIMDVIGHIREGSRCTFQQDARGGRCLFLI